MKICKQFLFGVTWLLFAATAACGQSPAVVNEIREAAWPSNGSPNNVTGRPLPLAAHWNLGEEKNGFDPEYQMKLVERGHHILPWFQLPNQFFDPTNPRALTYYEGPIKQAARLRLPISFVSTQWESLLSVNDEFKNLPAEQNPNVVLGDGKVRPEVSPFGPTEPWRAIGARWASGPMLKRLQELYPDPPTLLFLSNNEHTKLQWMKAEEDRRFGRQFGRGRDDEFKRRVVGDGWIAHYRALQQGIREGLGRSWKERVRFIGYDAFGPAHFGRWPGWMEFALYSKGRVDPWPLAWDGGSPSFYVFNWAAITDYTVFSPQVEAMNWVFMQNEAWRLNPNFWFELSVWDGHELGAPNDKRQTYAKAGQRFTPERYGGMVQFGMWLLRPRVVREFRGYRDTREQMEPYFQPILTAVDRVHNNATLREFWQRGQLVPNHAGQHPYQALVPAEYKDVDRWFLLDVSVNPKQPWELGTVLPVFALALVQGSAPRRQWLLYAHAPLAPQRAVQVTIPGQRPVKIDVGVGGSFYVVDERTAGQGRLIQ